MELPAGRRHGKQAGKAQAQVWISPGPWLLYEHPVLIGLSHNCLSSPSSVRGEPMTETGAAQRLGAQTQELTALV